MGALRLGVMVFLAVVGASVSAAHASEWENPRETYGADWECGRMQVGNPTYDICKRCDAEAGTFYWKVPEGATMFNEQLEFYKGRCEHPEGAGSSGSDSGSGSTASDDDGGSDDTYDGGGSDSGSSGGYDDDSGADAASAHDVVFRICNKSKFATIYVATVGPANEEDLGTSKVEGWLQIGRGQCKQHVYRQLDGYRSHLYYSAEAGKTHWTGSDTKKFCAPRRAFERYAFSDVKYTCESDEDLYDFVHVDTSATDYEITIK